MTENTISIGHAKNGQYSPTKSDSDVVIILEDCEFMWSSKELKHLCALWEQGLGLEDMLEVFVDYDGDEVFLALMHLVRRGKIRQRLGGLFKSNNIIQEVV